MVWMFLLIAGVLEIFWTTSKKQSQGFTLLDTTCRHSSPYVRKLFSFGNGNENLAVGNFNRKTVCPSAAGL